MGDGSTVESERRARAAIERRGGMTADGLGKHRSTYVRAWRGCLCVVEDGGRWRGRGQRGGHRDGRSQQERVRISWIRPPPPAGCTCPGGFIEVRIAMDVSHRQRDDHGAAVSWDTDDRVLDDAREGSRLRSHGRTSFRQPHWAIRSDLGRGNLVMIENSSASDLFVPGSGDCRLSRHGVTWLLGRARLESLPVRAQLGLGGRAQRRLHFRQSLPMEPIFKELTKLEQLSVPSSSSSSSSKKAKTASSASSGCPPLSVTLDGLIAALVKAQSSAASHSSSEDDLGAVWSQLESEIAGSKEKVDEVSAVTPLRG